jgi:hypothetical protein
MSMIGSKLFDCSAPLGLPRSAPLSLTGDDQSLCVDFVIRQSGSDQVSSNLPYDKMTSQPGLKGISNEITKDNTVHLGLDVS